MRVWAEIIILRDIIQTQKSNGVCSLLYMDSNFELEYLYLNGITHRKQKTFKGIGRISQ